DGNSPAAWSSHRGSARARSRGHGAWRIDDSNRSRGDRRARCAGPSDRRGGRTRRPDSRSPRAVNANFFALNGRPVRSRRRDMTVKRRPGGRTARTKSSVFEAVTVLVTERGYGAFNMTEVAERAGVAVTSLYRRWGDVRVLIMEVAVERLLQEYP